jgi:hypothetical protein
MKEEWMVVKNYPVYEVSTLGRVRNRKTQRILNQSIQSSGNAIVCLSNNGCIKTYSVCRLMLETFSPCLDMDKLSIVYKDNNKSNNVLDNLEWSDGSYATNKVALPNEIKELKNSIQLSIDRAFSEWCKKYKVTK